METHYTEYGFSKCMMPCFWTCWKYYCHQQCHWDICTVRHKLHVQFIGFPPFGWCSPHTAAIHLNQFPASWSDKPSVWSHFLLQIWILASHSWNTFFFFGCVFVSSSSQKTGLLMIKLPATPCSLHIAAHWSQNWIERNGWFPISIMYYDLLLGKSKRPARYAYCHHLKSMLIKQDTIFHIKLLKYMCEETMWTHWI